jgi:histidine kinase/DNA gyrase B/HSP90-like ATPase
VPIVGDENRLQQVVWDLVSNALKFTPSGGRVTVDVMASRRDATLTVTDTGMGIPAKFLPHGFDKFRQADVSVTRQQGGLGPGWLSRGNRPGFTAARLKRAARARDPARPSSSGCRCPPARTAEGASAVQWPHAAWPTMYQIAMTEKGTPSSHATM